MKEEKGRKAFHRRSPQFPLYFSHFVLELVGARSTPIEGENVI